METIQELQESMHAQYDRLEQQYQQKFEELEQRKQDQLNQYRQQMMRLIREQRDEEEARIRNAMDLLAEETVQRVTELKQERQREIESLQERFRIEIGRLVHRIEEGEKLEREYAREQYGIAQDAYHQLCSDPVVQQFLPNAAGEEADRLNAIPQMMERRLYTVAAAQCIASAVRCRSDRSEAKTIKGKWDNRRKAVEERLNRLNALLSEKLDSPRQFQHITGSTTETPGQWVDALPPMKRLRKQLDEAQSMCAGAAAGNMDAFDAAELSTFGMEDTIETMAAKAERRILDFLCCLEVQHIFYFAAGEDWEASGSVERFTNEGQMNMWWGLHEQMKVQVSPMTEMANTYVLTVVYTGYQSNAILRRGLDSILKSFTELISSPEWCGMQVMASSPFTEDGAPGTRLDLRLTKTGFLRQDITGKPRSEHAAGLSALSMNPDTNGEPGLQDRY